MRGVLLSAQCMLLRNYKQGHTKALSLATARLGIVKWTVRDPSLSMRAVLPRNSQYPAVPSLFSTLSFGHENCEQNYLRI
jgi:hypothetical protein